MWGLNRRLSLLVNKSECEYTQTNTDYILLTPIYYTKFDVQSDLSDWWRTTEDGPIYTRHTRVTPHVRLPLLEWISFENDTTTFFEFFVDLSVSRRLPTPTLCRATVTGVQGKRLRSRTGPGYNFPMQVRRCVVSDIDVSVHRVPVPCSSLLLDPDY